MPSVQSPEWGSAKSIQHAILSISSRVIFTLFLGCGDEAEAEDVTSEDVITHILSEIPVP